MTLGEKIRKLRHDRKMTLRDIAEKTGYSKALISRIENDSVSPSINSLVKIAQALEIKLYRLFASVEGSPPVVVKKKGRSTRTPASESIRVESLSGDDGENKMNAAIMTFDSGAGVSERKSKSPTCEEWWTVLKGRLEVLVGDNRFELSEGDSIYLNSSAPHSLKNLEKTKAMTLVTTMGKAD
jgi:transcriptional regulator with XRE-family HTH domain